MYFTWEIRVFVMDYFKVDFVSYGIHRDNLINV